MSIRSNLCEHSFSMTTKEQHLNSLKRLCRVCGKRLQDQYTAYSCLEAKDDLHRAFGIDVTPECSPEVYPSHFCKLCYATLLQIKAAEKREHRYVHSIDVMKWEEHSDNCKVNNDRNIHVHRMTLLIVHI